MTWRRTSTVRRLEWRPEYAPADTCHSGRQLQAYPYDRDQYLPTHMNRPLTKSLRRAITMDTQTETLAEEELAAITGYQLPSKQIQWLSMNGWQYVLTRSRRPIVGRVYARLKLAGVSPSANNSVTETWTLDLSRVG